MLRFGIIIPARFGAQRLPGKPLREVAGKPLIVHVYENALRANADFTIVATDDQRIAKAIVAIGGDVEMTESSHGNGTERLAEVVDKRSIPGDSIIVNVQGDEPLLSPEVVCEVARALRAHDRAHLSTLVARIHSAKDMFDPNVVKVVLDHEGFALYFSRSPIPSIRNLCGSWDSSERIDASLPLCYRHFGIYAYRADTLLKLKCMPPSPNEVAESLEQLRALYWGLKIQVTVTDSEVSKGIDTEEDLARYAELLRQRTAGR